MNDNNHASDGDRPGKNKPAIGYPAEELVKAPFKPPQPDASESAEDVEQPKIKFLIAAGSALGAIGLLLMLASPILGFIVMLLGAAAVAFSVLADPADFENN